MNSEVRIEPVDPTDDDARRCVEAYFAELDRRFPDGFDGAGSLESDAELLRPPNGIFVLARVGDAAVGCGVVHTFEPGVGEIKRMWVDESARGGGVGGALLAELERRSSELGHRIVRLDTNENLPEAIALYRNHGYVEIERYNDNPYPTHFFEKRVG